MSTAAIMADGVLRTIVGLAPIPTGIALYRGLATQFNIVLLTDDWCEDDGGLKYWLNIEGLTEHVNLYYAPTDAAEMSAGARRLDQLSRVTRDGSHVGLVVEPDPDVSARLIVAGNNVLTFTMATYSLPEWRPDYNPNIEVDDSGAIRKQQATPWNSLAAGVAHEAELRAKDRRTEQQESM